VVTVVSEFGRTFREKRRARHRSGHGSLVWLFGGELPNAGNQGEQAPLRPDTLHEARDVPVLNGLLTVLARQIARLFDLEPSALERVFPGSAL
jgi:uncharacterized protein (DUF1501 family)